MCKISTLWKYFKLLFPWSVILLLPSLPSPSFYGGNNRGIWLTPENSSHYLNITTKWTKEFQEKVTQSSESVRDKKEKEERSGEGKKEEEEKQERRQCNSSNNKRRNWRSFCFSSKIFQIPLCRLLHYLRKNKRLFNLVFLNS